LKHGTRTAIRIACTGNAGPVTESSLSIDVYTAIRFLRFPEDKAIATVWVRRAKVNLNAPRVRRQPLELSDRPDGRCRDEDFSPPTGSPEAAPPAPTERWRADFQRHALRQLVHSFHCYLFKFRFHGS
jgi:hypothetical protein